MSKFRLLKPTGGFREIQKPLIPKADPEKQFRDNLMKSIPTKEEIVKGVVEAIPKQEVVVIEKEKAEKSTPFFFDYERLVKIIKDNLNIKVEQSGGGGGIVTIKNVRDVAINPATVEKQDEMISDIQNLVGFEIPAHDYIGLTQASLTDTWTYKSGGAGGTTVGTVVVTYTDSGKGTIDNVTKT